MSYTLNSSMKIIRFLNIRLVCSYDLSDGNFWIKDCLSTDTKKFGSQSVSSKHLYLRICTKSNCYLETDIRMEIKCA